MLAFFKGVCFRHGAIQRICSHEGCSNVVINSGYVQSEFNAILITYQSSFRYYTFNYSYSRLCRRHGAKVRLCKVDGCTNEFIKGGALNEFIFMHCDKQYANWRAAFVKRIYF